MIIDTFENAGKYSWVHPLFARAFEYIKSQNLESMEPGTYQIDGERLRVIVANGPGVTAKESAAHFECHNKHIDIQLCISGTEQMGWKPRSRCMQPRGEYSEEKDVLFYGDTPDMYFTLKKQQFVVFFPEDVHAPMISEGEIRKLVVKLRL